MTGLCSIVRGSPFRIHHGYYSNSIPPSSKISPDINWRQGESVTGKKDSSVVFMRDAATWESWLEDHQDLEGGIWIPIAKKGSTQSSVTYDEALDVALCFGWVDGHKKSLDDDFFLQRFTHRRPGSLWSKRNVRKVERLMEAGRLRSTGLASSSWPGMLRPITPKSSIDTTLSRFYIKAVSALPGIEAGAFDRDVKSAGLRGDAPCRWRTAK
jgi:hypothetical protein